MRKGQAHGYGRCLHLLPANYFCRAARCVFSSSLKPSRSDVVMAFSRRRHSKLRSILERLISAWTPTCRTSFFNRPSSFQNLVEGLPSPAIIAAYSSRSARIWRSCHSGSRLRNNFQSRSLDMVVCSFLELFLPDFNLYQSLDRNECTELAGGFEFAWRNFGLPRRVPAILT